MTFMAFLTWMMISKEFFVRKNEVSDSQQTLSSVFSCLRCSQCELCSSAFFVVFFEIDHAVVHNHVSVS